MVKFIESELILLKKEIDEMWTLVYNQLDRAGEAVLTLDKELAQQVMVRERRVNAFELKYKTGDPFRKVTQTFQICVNLQHSQHKTKINRHRIIQCDNIFHITIYLQFKSIHPALANSSY